MWSRRSSNPVPDGQPDGGSHQVQSPSALSRRSSIGSNKSNLSRWSRQTSVANTAPLSRSGSAVGLQGAAGTRDPWRGHPGHLTDDQQRKLAELRTQLGAKGIYDEAGANANGDSHGKGSIPEGTLLRFLRARKFDVAGAAKQYEDFVRWRTDKGIDEAYEHYDVDKFETLRSVYPMWTGRRDNRGMPIYVYKISALTPARLSSLIPDDSASSKAIAVVTFVLIRFLLPFCSSLERERPEVPVSGTTSIIDVGGVGLSRFWGLRTHLQVASQVASANFPETIDRVLVVGAPSFFPTVYNWAKKWFDPGTVEKIHILSSNPYERLLEHMPAANIPREYGGELDWTYGDAPTLGEAERAQLGGEHVSLRGPVCWDQEEGKVLYLGTVDGKMRDLKGEPAGAAQAREGRQVEDADQVKPASKDDKPLMASFIPSSGTPASLVHVTSNNTPSSPLSASATPSPAVARTNGTGTLTSAGPPAKHLPNGTSPAHDPPHAPELGFVPGTHEPLTDKRVRARSSPPNDAHEPKSVGLDGSDGQEVHNEAVAKGWIPGSGVTEQEFLRSVGGMQL